MTLLTAATLVGCNGSSGSSETEYTVPTCEAQVVEWSNADGTVYCSANTRFGKDNEKQLIKDEDLTNFNYGEATFSCGLEAWRIESVESCIGFPTNSIPVNIEFNIDSDSTWYNYFSAVYAEIGKNHSANTDGYFGLGYMKNMGLSFEGYKKTNNEVGAGWDIFVQEDNAPWSDLITVAYDTTGLTNTGIEQATIITVVERFNDYVIADHMDQGEYYYTITPQTPNNWGTIELSDGVPQKIRNLSFNIDIQLKSDPTADPLISEIGTFTIDSSGAMNWDVGDDPEDKSGPKFDQPPSAAWKITGSISAINSFSFQ